MRPAWHGLSRAFPRPYRPVPLPSPSFFLPVSAALRCLLCRGLLLSGAPRRCLRAAAPLHGGAAPRAGAVLYPAGISSAPASGQLGPRWFLLLSGLCCCPVPPRPQTAGGRKSPPPPAPGRVGLVSFWRTSGHVGPKCPAPFRASGLSTLR